jgi:hypothetical protein
MNDIIRENPLDADNDIIGKKFKIVQCEARDHGDNEGCVCKLIGREVIISKRYSSPFCGTASYHLKGRKQRVRRSEIGLPNKYN